MSDVSNWSMPTAAPPTQADWNGVYGQTQTYLLNSLFAKHIDAKGNLDESGFYQDAAKNGLSPDQISTAMGYALSQKNNELGQVQTNQMLGLYGADPNAGGRNGATIGAPVKPDIQMIPNPAAQQPTKQASAPTAPSAPPNPSGPTNPLVAAAPVVADPVDATAPATPQAPQSPNGFGNFYAQLKAQAAAAKQQLGLGQPTDSVMNANGTTQAPVTPTTPLQIPDRNAQLAQFLGMKAQQANANGNLQAPAPLSASDSQGSNSMDLGQGKITPSGATLNADGSVQMQPVNIPPSATTPYQPPTPPDTRSATQRVVDSVDPSKSVFNQLGPQGKSDTTPDPSLFQWNVTNDGSNQFRQFSDALSAKLQSNGFSDPQSYLHQIYDTQLKQSITAPIPNAALMYKGPAGVAEFNGQVNAYAADVSAAKGKAEQAVLNARNDLSALAQTYGVTTVEQNKSILQGPDGSAYVLRDPAKRTEAAALLTNEGLINQVLTQVNSAGTNTTNLSMLAPQVARVYATALNPGQQLSDGNIAEVTKAMYPNMIGDGAFMGQAMLAVGRGLTGNGWDGLTRLDNYFTATSGTNVATRFKTLLNEAATSNAKSLDSYVTKQTGQQPGSGQPPAIGTLKTFPNGRVGKWDGIGWVAQ